jgi:hypothetical protein
MSCAFSTQILPMLCGSHLKYFPFVLCVSTVESNFIFIFFKKMAKNFIYIGMPVHDGPTVSIQATTWVRRICF